MMTSRHAMAWTAGGALLLVAAPMALSRPPQGDPKAKAESTAPSAEAKAIAALDQAFIQAFNKGDAKALAALFTEDAEVSDDSGATVVGREAIAKHFAATFEADPRAKIELIPEGLRLVGNDAARQIGRARVTPGDGGAPEVSRYTVLYVRGRDGTWLHDSIQEQEDRDLTAHDHLEELAWLLGAWVDEDDEAVVQTACRWSDDKNFLIREFTLRISGLPFTGGTQRIGWDAGKNRFKSWVFDTDGGHSEGVWTRTGPAEWTIRASGTLADGREVKATQVLTRVKPGLARWRSTDREIDGQSVPDTFDVVLVRTPPKAGGSAKAPGS